MKNDIFGQAMLDFYQNKFTPPLILHTSYGPAEPIPPERFFPAEDEFPDIDYFALEQARGSILDIGAGTGRHALHLQAKGADITAADISPACVKIMEESGLNKIVRADIFAYREQRYDTLLMLMNGIGIAGNLVGLEKLLRHLKKIINPGGQLLTDSTNISYLYEGSEKPTDRYFGELTFRYEYKNKMSSPINWLYVDQDILTETAKKSGWDCQIIFEDETEAYLARLQTT